MSVTTTTLRSAFPEFASHTLYPDAMVQLWLDAAARLVNADRWGESTDLGIMLFTAHRLVLAAKSAQSAALGGPAGAQMGVVTSKSVDGVSVSYDVGSVTEENAGHYNMTTYGIQFVQMARLHGAGPVHVGGTGSGQGVSMRAWAGVIMPPF